MKLKFEKLAQPSHDVLDALEGRIDKLVNHGVRQKVFLKRLLKRARSSDEAVKQAFVKEIQEVLSEQKTVDVCHRWVQPELLSHF